jgi:two-component system sensor histidine kinase VicK
MLEGFLAVPMHFTIEFLGFLVAIGGAILVLSRPGLVPGAASNRWSVGLGLGALGVAQVLHGGSFYPSDGDPLLAAIRALAYAFILIGVVGGLRPASATAIAGFELQEPLLLAPAGAALLVSLAALSVTSGDGSRDARRLGLGMFFLAGSELLTAGAPDTEAYLGGVFNRFAYGAHGLKLIGFLFLASWLWSAVRSSIRTRFVASFGALLVAVILALSTALTGVISNNIETEELNQIEAQVDSAADSLGSRGDEIAALTVAASNIASLEEVQERMTEGASPLALATEIKNSGFVDPDLDFVIVDPKGALPGVDGRGPSVARRKGFKDRKLTDLNVAEILGSAVVKEVAAGRPLSASPVRVDNDSAALVAASQVRLDGQPVAGEVIIGKFVDALMIEEISERVQASASLVVDGRVVASELPRAARRSLRVPRDVEAKLGPAGGGVGSVQHLLGGSAYFSGFASIEGGDRSVAVLVISSPADIVASTRQGVTAILFLAAMLVGAVALVLAYLSGRRITRPIQNLTTTAMAVREGDLTAQARVEGEDEVGQLGETFNEMTTSLLKLTNDLRTAAREEHDLRARIETILESMADGLVAVDRDSNVLAFNREAENLTGVQSREAVGKGVDKVLCALDSQGSDTSLPIFSLAEGSVSGIFLKRRGSDPVPVAVTSAVLLDEDDQVAGAVAVIRDMTREREVERMKTEFLSNISHELRTPLTPIKGYAEILNRKNVPPEKSKQFVRGILDSTARLERIVELLVDFSAMEAGRMAPRTTSVDVREMMKTLADDWSQRVTNHEVVVDLPETLAEIMGDERLLKRSLEEVIDNAVKFSPQGGEIRLSARGPGSNGSAQTERVEMSVSDQGIGISESDLPKIFSDFHQLDGSETRTFGGLGLGLAFVQRIVEAHDGVLGVESRPDEGTKLTIAIPALVAPAEGPSGTPEN